MFQWHGIICLVAGDFFQLPPIKAQPIYATCLKAKDDVEDMGARLFTMFRRMLLTEQMRSRDPDHTRVCNALRDGNCSDLVPYLQKHVLQPRDYEKFHDVSIVSPGNPERFYINFMGNEI